MRIVAYVESAKCQFCGKDHDGAEVLLDNGKKQVFCWPDLKRIVKTGILSSPEKKT